MKQVIACLAVASMVVACTSSTSSDDGCADISGNYTIKVTTQSGGCTGNDVGNVSDANVTIGKDADGLYIILPGLDGHCPGSLDAGTCRFKAECRTFDKADSSKTTSTFVADYTFAGKTFSGSFTAGIVAKSCSESETHEGTRL